MDWRQEEDSGCPGTGGKGPEREAAPLRLDLSTGHHLYRAEQTVGPAGKALPELWGSQVLSTGQEAAAQPGAPQQLWPTGVQRQCVCPTLHPPQHRTKRGPEPKWLGVTIHLGRMAPPRPGLHQGLAAPGAPDGD